MKKCFLPRNTLISQVLHRTFTGYLYYGFCFLNAYLYKEDEYMEKVKLLNMFYRFEPKGSI